MINIEKTQNQDKIKGNHLGPLDCILKMCKKSIPRLQRSGFFL